MKKLHAAGQLILVALLLFSFSGCVTGILRGDYPTHKPLLEKEVHKIESVQLEKLSQSKPITLKEAAESFVKKVVKSATEEAKIPIRLEDVHAAVLANNLELKVQLVNPSIAQEAVNSERAKFEAMFSGAFSYSDSQSPAVTKLQGDQSQNTFFSAGVQKLLPTGGEIAMKLQSGKYKNNNPYSVLNPAFDSDMQFSISQPLLRGAGIRTNMHSIRIAEYQKKNMDAQTKLEAIRLLANADKAYWQVYSASRQLGVAQQHYDLAVRQLKEAKLRVQAEAAPKIEITRAESGLAARLEGIIVATTGMRLYERDLKRMMNRADLPMESTASLNLLTEPNPVGMSFDPKSLSDYAVANRMEMLESELQLAMSDSQIDFNRNAKLPLFMLDYNFNINGLGSNYGHSFDQIYTTRYTDWAIGLRTEIPIGNQAAKAKLRSSLLERVQRLATKEQRLQSIRQEVLIALDLLDENWQRILAARQEAISAARTYEAERRQFVLGVRTSTDVLNAAGLLAQAQLREIQALVDYQIAQIDIAYAAGTLLGQTGVEWSSTELN